MPFFFYSKTPQNTSLSHSSHISSSAGAAWRVMRLSSAEVVEKVRVTECDASTTRTRRRRRKNRNDNKTEKRKECKSETKGFQIGATQENLEKAVSDE